VDITDIFDDAPKTKSEPEKVDPPIDAPVSTAELSHKAKEVAKIFDVATSKTKTWNAIRQKKIAAIDEELAHMQAEAEAAQDDLDKAKDELQEAMEKAKINTISMPDRTPVKLKITPGRRKPVSKKLLTEVYGKPKAEDIWSETEKKGPDKTTLVIPEPFEDEPGD
jgi:hypothetical protein